MQSACARRSGESTTFMSQSHWVNRWYGMGGILLFAAVLALVLPSTAHADGFIDFENGTDQQTIQSTIPGLRFTTTANYDWIYGDWRTGDYNGPYPHGAYTSNGNFFAWLGPNQGYGRIDFTAGCGTYMQVYVSSLAGLHMDAYYPDNTLAATAFVNGNLFTGQLARLRVDAPAGDCFTYVILHDTGNFWLIDDLSTDAAGVPATRPPVIVLPGLMGSRLDVHNTCSNETWEVWPAAAVMLVSPFDGHLASLKLQRDGLRPANPCEQIVAHRTATGSTENAAILRVGPDLHIGPLPFEFYAPLIDSLRVKGYDVFPYGYDWRINLRRIADQPSSTDDLDGFINQVLASTGAHKVNIVAHSLGGLLARYYVTSDPARAAKVEQIISLGTPYLGAPKSLRVLRWGDTGEPGWLWGAIGLYSPMVRDISQNAPAMYQILPTFNYFLVNNFPANNRSYYTFDGVARSWPQMQSLLRTEHNDGLAADAEAFHNAAMDDWRSSSLSTAYRLIVGSGKSDTPAVLHEKTLFEWNGFRVITWDMENTNGDGTVPLPSAALRGSGRDFSGNAPTWYTQGLNHLQLVKEPYVLDFVAAILATPPTAADDPSFAIPASPSYSASAPSIFSGDKSRFRQRSPYDATPPVPPQMGLTPFAVNGVQAVVVGNSHVHLYDSAGNHTGPTPDGLLEIEVPGSDYVQLGATSLVSFPANGVFRIEIESSGAQQVDLKVRRLQGLDADLTQRTITYADAPVGVTGTARLIYDPTNSGTAPGLTIDQDGDGTPDLTMPPTGDVGADGSRDTVAPQINVQLTGQRTTYGWYVGQVVVTAVVTDESSGVSTIKYSVNNGADVLPYTASFTVQAEQVQKVVFQATDRAGNRASVVAHVGPSRSFVSYAFPVSPAPPSAWRQGAGMNGRTVYDLAGAASACSTLFAATDQGLFRSTDRGANWANVFLPTMPAEAASPPFEDAPVPPDAALMPAVAVCAGNPQVAYATSWGGGVYRSDNGGGAWRPASNGLGDRYLYDLAVHPSDCNTVYAATNATGVFKTTDGGASWQPRSSGLGNLATRVLTLAPGAGQRLYVGTTAGVYRSDNAGGSWAAAASLPGGAVWALSVAPNQADTVYAGLESGGVYKSTNAGASWQPANTNLGFSKVRTLLVDPLNAQMVYAGNDLGRGVYRSSDGGAAWSEFNAGLGNRNVKVLWQDGGACHALYAGAANGAWTYR